MSRTSINPRCPYCEVRHSTNSTWRCREREEEVDAAVEHSVSWISGHSGSQGVYACACGRVLSVADGKTCPSATASHKALA